MNMNDKARAMAEKLETERFLDHGHEPVLASPADDAAEWKPQRSFPQSKEIYYRVLSHGVVFLLTSAVWLLVLLSRRGENPHHPTFDLRGGETIFKGHNYIGCGTSLEEAYSRGCVYDMLANHFVHQLCYDEDAISEYQAEGSTWKGYMDMNWTEPIPTTSKAMGEAGVYWTNQRDHIVHCAMLWKKQWRAFTQNRRYRDAIIVTEEHVEHCSQFLMDMTEEKDFD